MKIEIRGPRVVYITIGKTTYYIDDSTGEEIVEIYKPNGVTKIKTNKNGSTKNKRTS